jgi:hypothetical protein
LVVAEDGSGGTKAGKVGHAEGADHPESDFGLSFGHIINYCCNFITIK